MTSPRSLRFAPVAAGDSASASLRVLAWLVLFAVLALPALAAPRELVIFHFNDAHGYIHARPEGDRRCGGMSLLAGALARGRREAAARGAATLTLFGGDMFQGTAVVEATRGRCMVDLFNRLPLDAACLGNHEFDYGRKVLGERLREARYPIVGANVHVTGALAGLVRPSVLLDRQGLKIGIVGGTTPQTPVSSFPDSVRGFTFGAPDRDLPPEIARLEKAGARILIALTHDGVDDDKALARAAPRLDVIVGGHSHTALQQPVVEGKVPIVQAGEYTRFLGEVRLALDADGRVEKLLGARLIRLCSDEVPADAAIQRRVDRFLAPVERAMAEVVGQLALDVPHGPRGDESPMATLLAEAIRAAAGTEVALMNHGGVRRALPAGPLTRGALIEVAPFGNTLVTFRLTGRQLRAVLEKSASGEWVAPSAEHLAQVNKYLRGRKMVAGMLPGRRPAGFVQAAGLAYAFDPRLPDGRRLVEASVNGRPLEDARTYTVACTNFLASGGDGFSELKEMKDRKDSPVKDRDMLIAYFRKHRPLEQLPTGAVRNLANRYEPLPALTGTAPAH